MRLALLLTCGIAATAIGCNAGFQRSPEIVVKIVETPPADLASSTILITLRNRSQQELNLDGRLLRPILLVEVRDKDGNVVPSRMFSPPKPVQKSDVISLHPNAELKIEAQLSHITPVHLDMPPYSVRAYYATERNYPAELGLWCGEAKSNVVTIGGDY